MIRASARPRLAERILLHDRLNLRSTRPDREDDSAIPRNLAPRDQEVAGGVILLQELDVRRHVRVDLGEIDLVDQLDDEHDPSACRKPIAG